MEVANYQVNVLDIRDTQQVTKCYQVFSFLRPHLNQAEFLKRVNNQSNEGYKIAYIELEGQVVAAAGYRVVHFLAWGRVFYIDDLITLPDKKRKGLGGALLDWLIARGTELDCDEVHLDSGYQRHDAHRLYLNKGLDLNCHHLARKLK